MKEIILKNKKNGLLVLLLSLLIYAAAIAATVKGAFMLNDGKSPALMIVGIIFLRNWLLFFPHSKFLTSLLQRANKEIGRASCRERV